MKRKHFFILTIFFLFISVSGFAAPKQSIPQDGQKFAQDFIKQVMPGDFVKVIALLIPITFITGTMLLLIFSFKWSHKRRLLMIKKGQVDPTLAKYKVNSLLWGIILTSLGIGIILRNLIVSGNIDIGIIIFSLGMGLLIFRWIITKEKTHK